MECPVCQIVYTDRQLEALVVGGYHELFLGPRDEYDQTMVIHELDAANRRCEKRHGCSWATHLERFWKDHLLVIDDAQIILHNNVRQGILYLELRGLGHDTIAEVYCIREEEVARIFESLDQTDDI